MIIFQNSISNNDNSEHIITQTNSDCIEQISIDNEQQRFVEIRSSKRSIERDCCNSQIKKQKLDMEDKSVNEEYSQDSGSKLDTQIYNKNTYTNISKSTVCIENNVLLVSDNKSIKSSEASKTALNNKSITTNTDVKICSELICNTNNENNLNEIENITKVDEKLCHASNDENCTASKDSLQYSADTSTYLITRYNFIYYYVFFHKIKLIHFNVNNCSIQFY